MPRPPLRSPLPPAHDEWGVYDPEQAGLSALFARLDSKDTKTQDSAAEKLVAKSAKTPKRPDLTDSH